MIELLYVAGCPHHDAFLPHLTRLLVDLDVPEPVRLVEITGDEDARARRFLGSPTLRIDGVDVDPSALGRTDFGMQCRLYPGQDGFRGTPPDAWILKALKPDADEAHRYASR